MLPRALIGTTPLREAHDALYGRGDVLRRLWLKGRPWDLWRDRFPSDAHPARFSSYSFASRVVPLFMLRRFPTTTCLHARRLVRPVASGRYRRFSPARQYSIVQAALTPVSIAIAVALPLITLVESLILALQWIIGLLRSRGRGCSHGSRAAGASHILGEGTLPASVTGSRTLVELRSDPRIPCNRNPTALLPAAAVPDPALHADADFPIGDVRLARGGLRGSPVVDAVGNGRALRRRMPACYRGTRRSASRPRTPEGPPRRRLHGWDKVADYAFLHGYTIADAFGRSLDMSGRSVIWHRVADLIAEHPVGEGVGSSDGRPRWNLLPPS